ncbi:PREDICTED: dimethylallylcistransferase, chloroplastic-like [Nicotiana attenuata]|uniref:Alkyl transferase n=1 Tax=Nicotiana attenuata TaxID=49451 RepID=A0A1J6KBI4_NICAT|nr:PREDICTED: dimethylallylcistransferase, chloroplastic-like [Nicotiana attenuata]OIT27437.1 dimethylallylcistransferase, chloroplastic [Nicotiana attenuata]
MNTNLLVWPQLLPCKSSNLGRRSSSPSPLNSSVSAVAAFYKISNSQLSLSDNYDRHCIQIIHNPELIIPKHVAIIMDGNRRWAKARGLPVEEGHKFLTPNLKNICNISSKLGIQVLTAFAFSTENWTRSKEEVYFLMNLFEEFFEEFMRFGVRVFGNRPRLPITLQKGIELIEKATKANEGLHLMLALNYGGHYDILEATKSIASKVKDGLLQLEDIDYKLFEQELATKYAKFAKPDLLIRTGGEQRISNFLLWQIAYSELYFTKTLFPDFGEEELKEAIRSFQQRHRRFGGHTY